MLEHVEIGDAEGHVGSQREIGLVYPGKRPVVGKFQSDRHVLGERVVNIRCGGQSIGIDIDIVQDQKLVVKKIEILVGDRSSEHQLSLGHEHRGIPETQAAVKLLRRSGIPGRSRPDEAQDGRQYD